MLNKIKMAFLSVLIGLGTLTAVPATAQADSFFLQFGAGKQGMDRHGVRPRACTPERAVRKAKLMGVRKARVRAVTRNRIRVVGRLKRRPVSIVFRRVQGCPVIR